jgi:chromosome segregation ATPase
MYPDRRVSISITTWISIVGLSLGACVSSSSRIGDRYYDSERYVEAAAAYETYLDEGVESRDDEAVTLFRLGLIYSRAESSLYDPARSMELLERSLELKPDSPYNLEARLILELARQVARLEREVVDRRRRIESLFSELSEMQEEVEKVEGQVGARQRTVETLSTEINGLRAQIDRLTLEVEQKEEELERLKAIDFETNR